jgi:uncharacterized protein YndB with AHSA1/START domain
MVMRVSEGLEVGTIEREFYIDAAPEVVFDVVSQPEHVAEWWPDEATYELQPGACGEVVFGDPASGGKAVTITVLEVERPTTFSFRWTHTAGDQPGPGNSLMVTFEMVASGAGTLVRFVESGFREMGWEAAELEANYRDHRTGWDYFLPRLAHYAESVRGRS